MNAPARIRRPGPAGLPIRTLLTPLLHVAAAAACAWYSWGFGARIGGPAMGLLLAVNAAVMAVVLLDAAGDAAAAYLRPRRRL